jgi:Uma2 family endonuclease
MAATTSLTIDDFERLPAEVAENHELVDGELIDVSGNTPRHNLLRDRLLSLLLRWAAERGTGTVIAEQEFDFLGNAHGPDLSFFGTDKQRLVDLDSRVQRFVPDIAIEIASESDSYDGLLRKKERYRRAGTAEVWLMLVQNREIAQYAEGRSRILRAEDVLSTPLLPGFSVAVEELFRGL